MEELSRLGEDITTALALGDSRRVVEILQEMNKQRLKVTLEYIPPSNPRYNSSDVSNLNPMDLADSRESEKLHAIKARSLRRPE
jgi:hypothetical protein